MTQNPSEIQYWWLDKNKERKNLKSPIARGILIIFGILLPLATLGTELLTHLCGEAYVDPIPTLWHALLIALVPIANLWAVRALSEPRLDHYVAFSFVLGVSIAVSLIYSLVFLPLLPFACIAVLFYGIGFLPLSPLFGLIASSAVATYLRRINRPDGQVVSGLPALGAGFFGGLLIFITMEVLSTLTHVALAQAATEDPAKSRAGVRILRALGADEMILRSCYYYRGNINDISGMLFHCYDSVDSETARKIYYRVTGKPFNLAAKPKSELRFSDWMENFDPEVAGETVGGRANGVSLSSSNLIGNIYPDEAAGYLEWTMVFSNKTSVQQEARTQIALPPGAVISRATLWVNGIPQDAVFAEKGVVRAAYQAVVRKSRDPLLVTSVGPDRVLVQCFPVPTKNFSTDAPGEIKIRLGLTVPLTIASLTEGTLHLPRLLENNFDVSAGHHIRFNANGLEQPLKGLQIAGGQINGQLPDEQLSDSGVFLKYRRSPISQFWSVAPLSHNQKFIVESLASWRAKPRAKLIVVIDGGVAMRGFARDLMDGLSRIPGDMNPELIFASDEVSRLSEGDSWSNSVSALANAPYLGGPDNLPFLEKALSAADRTSDCAVLWIHGPQPILFHSGDATVGQNFRTAPELYELEVRSGPNRIAEVLGNHVHLHTVARQGELKQDIISLIPKLAGKVDQYSLVRRVSNSAPGGAGTMEAERSSQLAALWASTETQNKIAAGKVTDAVKLASEYRIVTPVTGAVVLETKEQYLANGLDPDNPENNKTKATTPELGFALGAAPEPHEWCLMIIAFFTLAWQIWSKRRFANTRA